MPKPKAVASLSNLIYSDMEKDGHNSGIDTLPTPESNLEDPVPSKRVRRAPGRPKGTIAKNTRAQTARRYSGGPLPIKKKIASRKKIETKRTILNKQTKNQREVDNEAVASAAEQERQESEAEDTAVSMDELVPKEQPRKRGRAATKAREQPEVEPFQQTSTVENDGEFEYTPTAVRQLPKKAGVGAKETVNGRPERSAEPQLGPKIIPETQEAPLDLEVSMVQMEEDFEDDIPQSVFRRSNNKRSNSRQPQPFFARRLGGNVSDTDRANGDTAIRRKLGDMTKKFDSLDMKYKNLREIGIKQAGVNFEKLKVQSEVRANAANELIVSLKEDLATQTAIAQESSSLQTQLTASDLALTQAQQQITELTSSLSEAQNEIKALQVKLANSRSASAAVESVNAKTPGSAMKGKGQPRTIMVGSAEAAQAAQVALLKEDLYSDLTGLILRGVERGDESDVYDCIQTGRNGTLHFKLAVATDTDAKIHYEDTTFLYTPRLDTNRDRDLLEILPDYLSEEIAFSRVNAAKFYGRVVETLTKRRAETFRDG